MITQALTVQGIERAIHLLRGHKVLLDGDQARLYGVPTKSLNLAVKRNLERFPADFMFRLTAEEYGSLRFQSETSKGRGGRRYLPHAFTQEGVSMLSSVLGSKQAIAVNIEIMRVFVRLRHAIAVSSELALRLKAVEASLNEHRASLNEHRAETAGRLAEHERRIRVVFEAIKQLMDQDEETSEPRAPIGFEVGGEE